MWALAKCRYYQEVRHFTMVTDHSSLVWVFKTQQPTARLTNWVLHLQELTFSVEYQWGMYNTVPDALSRVPSNAALRKTSAFATLLSVKGQPRWEIPISDEGIWRAQREELEIEKIYQSLVDGGELTEMTVKFTMLEDKVYRILQLPHKTIYWVYIEGGLWELLWLFHENSISSHLGRYKTYKRPWHIVQDEFRGEELHAKLSDTNKKIPKVAGKLQQTIVERPWEMLGVNLILYLVVFLNYYTHWVDPYSWKAMAETV